MVKALTREEALALMGNHGTVMSDTARMHRREFTVIKYFKCSFLLMVYLLAQRNCRVLRPSQGDLTSDVHWQGVGANRNAGVYHRTRWLHETRGEVREQDDDTKGMIRSFAIQS